MPTQWRFNGKVFTADQIGKFEGFVYSITNLITGKKYIGRKYFFSIRKTKGHKKRVRKESDWQTYYGSSKELAKHVVEHGAEKFRRDILSLHKTRGDTNYQEIRTQFVLNVLENDIYINDAIGKRRRPSAHIKESRCYANTSAKYAM